ncbi:TrmH family RNA methyltransferase [Muriicola sp.]|uniref:TrmH family RNA methyltransferase n=1 Tax=Muriicola sp. TaxID=2020856 RepID=UPI003C733D63
MQAVKHITSPQNALIKKLMQLKEKKKERLRTGTFVVEGKRELEMALKGGYHVVSIFFFRDLFSLEEAVILIKDYRPQPEFIEISKEVYQKLAYREKTEGILAIARGKKHGLDLLDLPKNPLILVAEAPEKPGNIGALLRTADAAGLDAVIIANPTSDLYNPNIIRSSIGCVFTVQTATGTTSEIINFLQERKINIYAAALSASMPYTTAKYTGATALVVGTESTGLSEAWLSRADARIIIPMEGSIDSMNVSVSAAILIFEAKRQRT